MASTHEAILSNERDTDALSNGFKQMPNVAWLTLLDPVAFSSYQNWFPFDETPGHPDYLDRVKVEPCGWLDRSGWDDWDPGARTLR